MHTLKKITNDYNVLLCQPKKENMIYGAIMITGHQLLVDQDDFDYTTIEFTERMVHCDLNQSHTLNCFRTGVAEWLVFYRDHQTGKIDKCMVLMTHNIYDDFEALYTLDERIGRQCVGSKFAFPIYNAWVNYE